MATLCALVGACVLMAVGGSPLIQRQFLSLSQWKPQRAFRPSWWATICCGQILRDRRKPLELERRRSTRSGRPGGNFRRRYEREGQGIKI